MCGGHDPHVHGFVALTAQPPHPLLLHGPEKPDLAVLRELLSSMAGFDEGLGQIEVVYLAGGTQTCDCECSHTLSYSLLEVPNGTWTVFAGGMSGQVVVN